MVASESSGAPPYYYLSPVPLIRQQGIIGSCASHATIRAIEYQLLAKNQFIEGSELYHYYCARKYINNTYPFDKGMSIRDAMNTQLKYGYAPEILWPYNVMKFNDRPSQAAFWMSSLFKISHYEKLVTIEQVKESIRQNKAVVIGIKVDKSFYDITAKENHWTPSGNTYGGHAVVIIGYDDNREGFIVENSWGVGWGDRGRFVLPYKILNSKWTFDWYRPLLKY